VEIAHRADEAGIKVPAPFRRHIQVLLAPDRHSVQELTFSLVEIPAGSGTDEHVHDRIELIFIIAGEGIVTCDGQVVPVAPDDVLFVRAGELHQVTNSGSTVMRMATVFVPGYPAAENYARCLGSSGSDEELKS
jgi:mannose-6-phosphate isomerase-like protein (cupin superfamily)